MDEFLNDKFRKEKRFPVNQPCSMTVGMADGSFRHKGFIGEEYLTPFAAYFGKKHDLILKFNVPDWHDDKHKWVEMNLHQARTRLDGFDTYFDDLNAQFIGEADEKDTEAELKAEREELALIAKVAQVEADPLYGSW